MIGKRFLGLVSASLAIGLLWFPYAAYRDFSSRTASLTGCEDNGIGAWKQVLDAFREQHGGRVPTWIERVTLAARYQRQSSHFNLTCNLGAPYRWNPAVRQINRLDPEPLVWCDRPHGFSHKWRNVLYSDLTVRRIPETEYLRLPVANKGRN